MSLVDAGIELLREDLPTIRIEGVPWTKSQLRTALWDEGYHLLDIDWHGRRQTAVLAGQLGRVLGRRVFFIGAPPHPYLCEGYTTMFSVGLDPVVIGNTAGLEESLVDLLPELPFEDLEGWCRHFVAARSMESMPALPRRIGWTGPGKLSARYLPERRRKHAMPDSGYFGESVFDPSLRLGLSAGDHAVAICAATAIIASWQTRGDLSMGWFNALIGAPILAARSVGDLRAQRRRASRILAGTNRRRMALRLALLEPHIQGRYDSVEAFDEVLLEVVARPGMRRRLAGVEDQLFDWMVEAFRQAFGVRAPAASPKACLREAGAKLARLRGRARGGRRGPGRARPSPRPS